jgi:tetratricopeptide (TPR) repeat protein
LADAYLDAGRALEARIISEDLVAREPWNRNNIDRFRRALVMLGENDPDAIISDRLSGESPFLATEKMDLNEGVTFDTPADPVVEEAAAVVSEPATEPEPAIEPEPVSEPEPAPAATKASGKGKRAAATPEPAAEEIDLTDLLADSPEDAGEPASPTPPAPRSLDQVFRGMRDESSRASTEELAAEQYRLAVTYHEMGMPEDAIKALEVAAKSPRQRFDAASMLGRLYLERSDTRHAVEWLERAAEAPAPTPDAGRALLYDLAKSLESAGEQTRALAVFVELESEARGYRDVAGQIERLSKVQSRG